MITELERRALMGDKQAQHECTEKGIVLRCPKCLSDKVRIEGDGQEIRNPEMPGCVCVIPDSIIYVVCDNCELCSSWVEIEEGKERKDAEKILIAQWNTRPAPPIGRCEECKFYTMLGHCKVHSAEPDQYGGGHFVEMSPTDYCSRFVAREREENVVD